jgi:hypothetical protein
VDIFDRFALAETATFVFVPLVILALEKPRGRRLPLLAGAFAGLCLAHLPTAYLAGLISLLWVACREWRRLPAVALMLLLGASCAAVYIVPAVAERPQVHADWLETNPAYRFAAHYLLGPRPLNVDDPIHGRIEGPVASPTLQRVRWVAPLTLLLALAAWGVRRWWRATHAPLADPLDRYAVLALVSALGMTRLADPAWRFLPGLASVVFPWRLTLFLTIAAAVLAGLTGAEMGSAAARARRLTGAGMLAGVLALAAVASWPSVRDADWQTFTTAYSRQPLVRLRVAGAFMPRSNPHMRGFGARLPAGAPRLTTADGGSAGRVDLLARRGHRIALMAQVNHPDGALLDLDVFDYPGWQATVDGKPTAHEQVPELGTLRLPLPPGRHDVEWLFTATPLRTAAAGASGLALAVLLGLTLVPGVRTMSGGRKS